MDSHDSLPVGEKLPSTLPPALSVVPSEEAMAYYDFKSNRLRTADCWLLMSCAQRNITNGRPVLCLVPGCGSIYKSGCSSTTLDHHCNKQHKELFEELKGMVDSRK